MSGPPGPGAQPRERELHEPASARPQDEAVGLEAVSVGFGGKPVLRGVNLSIRHAEIAVVIGGSGAGKTTLLRVMMGLVRPTAGRVYVRGRCLGSMTVRELQTARADLGMVFQYSALLDSLSVLDNVALPLREHTSLSSHEIQREVEQLLRRLDLNGVADRLPAELSGGMRKRVGLARALIRKPSIVMYDEPTSGLDPVTARLVDDLILRTRDEFGVTSVVISHSMVEALGISDHLLLLEGGEIVGDGPPTELVRDDSTLAARFYEASRPPALDVARHEDGSRQSSGPGTE